MLLTQKKAGDFPRPRSNLSVQKSNGMLESFSLLLQVFCSDLICRLRHIFIHWSCTEGLSNNRPSISCKRHFNNTKVKCASSFRTMSWQKSLPTLSACANVSSMKTNANERDKIAYSQRNFSRYCAPFEMIL